MTKRVLTKQEVDSMTYEDLLTFIVDRAHGGRHDIDRNAFELAYRIAFPNLTSVGVIAQTNADGI